MNNAPRLLPGLAVLLGLGFACRAGDQAEALFASEIRPLLESRCLKCHGGAAKKGGLDLSTRESLLKGGDAGPTVEPGKPKASRLLQLVAHDDEPHMPPKGDKLSDAAIAHISDWIAGGAPYDKPLTYVAAKDVEPHWAFAPLKHPGPPAVRDQSWPRNPIDAFLLSAMEATGLGPAGRASRTTLIRRLSFDLAGLPPSPDEVAAFVADGSPDAYTNLVDRLLCSPRFGERWGRHWLDVARYADSDGYETDRDRPSAYPYRDFVIGAINDDLPFSTFVRWQLAGDELAPGDNRALAATGFGTAGPVVVFNKGEGLPEELEQLRYDELDDMLATTGTAFLGLTVACARCHDHKYDPIAQTDYYRMLAAFYSTKREEKYLGTVEGIAAYRKREARFSMELNEAKAVREAAQGLVDNDALPTLDDRIKAVEATRPAEPPKVLTLTDVGREPLKSHRLLRGDPMKKAEKVELGVPPILSVGLPRPKPPDGATTTFQRAALADWLVDVDSGAGRLVARVIVNRLWQGHFGEGLVRTPNDFGTQGDRPSHPELLDWLASELIQNGWHLKPIHRLIVTSAAYQQSAVHDEAKARIDPENRLLWHRRPRRLEAEALRDAILSVSGSLDLTMGGPSIKPAVPTEAMAGRNKDDKVPRPKEDTPEQWRRTVYLFTKRSIPTPTLEVFDAPLPTASCGRRGVSTVAPQALALLNDPFVRKQAERFADRIMKDGGSIDDQVARAYRLALGRPPSNSERVKASRFLERGKRRARLVDLGQVLFGLNEFAYVD